MARRVTDARKLEKSPDRHSNACAWPHKRVLGLYVLTYSFVTSSQSCALLWLSHGLKGSSLRHGDVGLALRSPVQVGHSQTRKKTDLAQSALRCHF